MVSSVRILVMPEPTQTSLEIEENICIKTNQKEQFLKYTLSLRIYKAIMKILHVSKSMHTLPKIKRVFKIPKH